VFRENPEKSFVKNPNDEQTVKGLRKIAWASVLHSAFETAAYYVEAVYAPGPQPVPAWQKYSVL
jgi:hypothetical protein